MIEYPYLPQNRSFKFVPSDHVHMLAAAAARRECAGDSLYPVGVVLVRDGEVVARAGNGFNRGSGTKHICPRVVLDCPSGVGYELCDLHDPIGHAEPMLMKIAKEQGIDPVGCDVYMFGHWWCCEFCWNAMIADGIRDVYLIDDAHERFSRTRVQAETLASTVKSIFFSHAFSQTHLPEMKELIEALDRMSAELGCSTVIPFRDGPIDQLSHEHDPDLLFRWSEEQIDRCDVLIAEVSNPSFGVGGELALAEQKKKPVILLSKKGSEVSEFVLGNPAVVYHVEYTSIDDAVKQTRNVLRQL